MEINADFSKPAMFETDEMAWQPSPMGGVTRKMLDRIGGEVARATSLVQYAPGSHFSAHTHGGGEEFFVLSGVFQDEHGDYPGGTYVRNPPKTSHTPRSDLGCVIFVKLWQFDPEDRVQFRKNMGESLSPLGDGTARGLLHQDTSEAVSILQIDPHKTHSLDAQAGIEVFVLGGAGRLGAYAIKKGSWLRLPQDETSIELKAASDGITLWMKSGRFQASQMMFEG